jgi:nucleoside-diphosphate-sugar epimerase
VYVDDVVDAFVAAATAHNAAGNTIDIGSGELVSVREVVERLARRIAPDLAPRFGAVEDRPMEEVRVADAQAADALLGWRVTTTLDEGLERTVAWYSRLVERESHRASPGA